MKKKGLAVLLCLCMVVSLLPTTAQAAGSWTYYPKSDEEHRLSGYIKQGDLQVGVMSEKEADTGDKTLYNLVIGGNGDSIPAGVTEVDLTGTIKDEAGQPCYITELGSAIVNDQITSITLPGTVKRIKYNACLNAALTSINFPSNLESIGYGCVQRLRSDGGGSVADEDHHPGKLYILQMLFPYLCPIAQYAHNH